MPHGLFDTISTSICDVQKYLVKEVDAELNELHEKKLVVLYDHEATSAVPDQIECVGMRAAAYRGP